MVSLAATAVLMGCSSHDENPKPGQESSGAYKDGSLIEDCGLLAEQKPELTTDIKICETADEIDRAIEAEEDITEIDSLFGEMYALLKTGRADYGDYYKGMIAAYDEDSPRFVDVARIFGVYNDNREIEGQSVDIWDLIGLVEDLPDDPAEIHDQRDYFQRILDIQIALAIVDIISGDVPGDLEGAEAMIVHIEAEVTRGTMGRLVRGAVKAEKTIRPTHNESF